MLKAHLKTPSSEALHCGYLLTSQKRPTKVLRSFSNSSLAQNNLLNGTRELVMYPSPQAATSSPKNLVSTMKTSAPKSPSCSLMQTLPSTPVVFAWDICHKSVMLKTASWRKSLQEILAPKMASKKW